MSFKLMKQIALSMPANIQCLDVEKINSWKMHLKIVGFCEYQKAHSKK